MVTLTSVLRILKIMSLRLQPTCWCSLWKKEWLIGEGYLLILRFCFCYCFFFLLSSCNFCSFAKLKFCVCVWIVLWFENWWLTNTVIMLHRRTDGAEEEINHFGLVVMNWRNEILSSSCQKVWFWDLGVEWGVLNGTIIFIAWGEGSLENDAIYTLNLEAIDWELYFESCKKHGVLVLSCLPKLTFLCRFTWFLW